MYIYAYGSARIVRYAAAASAASEARMVPGALAVTQNGLSVMTGYAMYGFPTPSSTTIAGPFTGSVNTSTSVFNGRLPAANFTFTTTPPCPPPSPPAPQAPTPTPTSTPSPPLSPTPKPTAAPPPPPCNVAAVANSIPANAGTTIVSPPTTTQTTNTTYTTTVRFLFLHTAGNHVAVLRSHRARHRNIQPVF